MPERLKGLKVDEFAHKDDLDALNSLSKIPMLEKTMSFIEDKQNKYSYRLNSLGNCVRITENNNPTLYSQVKEVCKILDYDTIPEIYTYRRYRFDIDISGSEKPLLLIPDFAVRNLDEKMLYFFMGRAITRLKAGHLRMYNVAQIVLMGTNGIPYVSDAMKLTMSNWLRKSELTADRGGLLACQDFDVAGRALMHKAGLAFNEKANVDLYDYLKICQADTKLSKISKNLQTLTECEGWANDRIIELYLWYGKGYFDEVIDNHID